ncbi:MAG: permease prefix domain 1-containing protein [Bacteroidota bacterium]
METHLRDRVEHLINSGQSPEHAFDTAIDEIGSAEDIGRELHDVKRKTVVADNTQISAGSRCQLSEGNDPSVPQIPDAQLGDCRRTWLLD